jgi:signal transduction histidine kinase
MAVDPQGNVWVATLRGLSVFAPPESAQRPMVTPMVEEVTLDGVPVDLREAIRVPARARDLVIRYTAAAFLGPGRPTLRHRLVGVDADWSTGGSPAMAHYHALAPGPYVFELRARDATAALARLRFVVDGPFWRSRTMVVLLLAAAGAALLAFQRVRLARRRLQRQAIAEERARLARELHDGLSQKLRAVGLLSDRVRLQTREQATASGLVEMGQIVVQAHAELRHAIWDIREGREHHHQRLEPFIERVLAQIEVPPEMTVRLESAGSSLPVAGEAAREIPLVVREAVLNAVRHAHANRIDVGVLSDDEGLHVWVRDDGRGMPSDGRANETGGYGLIGMHERARRLGGHLVVHSEAGVGTEISLFVARGRRQS